MSRPTLLINFDPATWEPTAIFPNGQTDVETARLRNLAEVMLTALSGQGLEEMESYFQIGVSDDYILIRGDFPMGKISPGDFSKLCREMFRRNEEALHNGK